MDALTVRDRDLGDIRVTGFLNEVMISATGYVHRENVALCFDPDQAIAIAEAITRHAHELRLRAGKCPACTTMLSWSPQRWWCSDCGTTYREFTSSAA
jgi:ribosomal protein S27AE